MKVFNHVAGPVGDEKHDDPVEDDFEDAEDYNISKRGNLPLFAEFIDNAANDEPDYCLKRDIIWAIAVGTEEENEEHLIGSGTDFNRQVTEEANVRKYLLEYLPTMPRPPEYPVCKKFLDNLLKVMRDLNLDHIFAHGDEQFYARLAHIIWKDPELYRNTVILMEGFHELHISRKTIYKRHALRGYQKWVINAKTIAPGSSDAAVEGGHYYRNMKMNKELFCAPVQYRVEELINDYNYMDMELKSLFLNLRRKHTSENINLKLSNNEFQNHLRKILNNSHNTESKITVCFLQDVSTLLVMVSAVREKNFERHVLVERGMIKYCFTFNHINYSRYLTYQHVYLRTLLSERSKAGADLDERGFGGSLSGLPFKSLHGDLITEIFNGHAKRQADPHAASFSTDINKVNDWVRTAHIHAKLRLRCIFTEKIKLKTNSSHKECTPGARKLHVSNVKALKQQLRIYGCDRFAEVNARDITGEELPIDIIENLLNADSIGNEIS